MDIVPWLIDKLSLACLFPAQEIVEDKRKGQEPQKTKQTKNIH